jgi:hypothetical protein
MRVFLGNLDGSAFLYEAHFFKVSLLTLRPDGTTIVRWNSAPYLRYQVLAGSYPDRLSLLLPTSLPPGIRAAGPIPSLTPPVFSAHVGSREGLGFLSHQLLSNARSSRKPGRDNRFLTTITAPPGLCSARIGKSNFPDSQEDSKRQRHPCCQSQGSVSRSWLLNRTIRTSRCPPRRVSCRKQEPAHEVSSSFRRAQATTTETGKARRRHATPIDRAPT